MDINEIVKKYNINLGKLEEEQIKLAKTLKLKDSINFDDVERIGGCFSVFFQNKIISAIVVIDNELEIIEQQYFSDKLKFPYLSGFRAYRELPSMISCFDKLDVKPEVVFLNGNGILHPRNLGLASHFSIVTGIPAIGISDRLIEKAEIKNDKIFLNNKEVGRAMLTKIGIKPVFISPGNLISLETSVKIVKKFTKEPHKLPEPIVLAHKYGKKVRDDIFSSE